MSGTNKKYLLLITLFTVVILVAAYITGLFVDLTGDAGKYAAIARHIVESGDWINLKIHNEPYDQKPPLLFWLATLGFKLGGFHNWSFKIFPVLYSMLGIWFTFKLGESLYNKRTGQIAALMLATSWIYYMYAMDIHTDLVLQTNVTLAIWQLSVYLKNRKAANFIWAFVGIGLAMMTKGPVGGAVPAFALGTHLILKRDFKELFHPKWLIGIALALIVCLPAFIGLYQQFGFEGIKFFFVTNNIGRITGSYVGNSNDYFLYVHSLLYLTVPWTFLFLFGFYNEIRSYFRPSRNDREYLTVGGIWIYFFIVSIAKGKAPHYFFMLIPMMMVVVAQWLDHFLNSANPRVIRLLLRFQVINVILLAILIALLAAFIFPSKSLLFLIVILISAGSILYVLLSRQNTEIKLFLPALTIMGTLMFYLNTYAAPIAFRYQASTKASRLYNEKAIAREPLYNYLYGYYELFFYSKTNASQLYSITDFRPDPEHASWIFTTESGKDSVMTYLEKEVEEIYPMKHRGMNKLNPKFLNPATREASLVPMYLIKIRPDESVPENETDLKPAPAE